MKNISVISPVKNPRDISLFCKESYCRHFYVYYDKFIYGNFSEIEEFIRNAHLNNCKIYVNFKHDISEEDTDLIKKFILFLTYTKIDGIFVNSFAILEAVKNLPLDFDIIADSYFDIHNLAGIDFINHYGKTNKIVVTEEVYLKNLKYIKENTDKILAADSDNLPWCAQEIIKSETIDAVIIKGKFSTSGEILDGIKLIENILNGSSKYKNKNLPFKHTRNSYYQTNHFTGEIVNARGENFTFSKYIRPFKWKHKKVSFNGNEFYSKISVPKINLRLCSLSQLSALERFIKKLGFNPVYAIEYGEIVSTSDLIKNSFSLIMVKAKKFCDKYGIKLRFSTPRILIERDFERVYNDAKNFCKNSEPDSIVVNNIGFFWKLANDNDFKDIKVEIGSGINLLNSMSIRCLNDIKPLSSVDFTTFRDINNIRNCIKRLDDEIPFRKLTVSGNIRVPSLGLCPLNSDPAILSRLNCSAPCHGGPFAIHDPILNQIYPFVSDGFCRMHMFKDEILNLCQYIKLFEETGINEFVIDFSTLDTKFVPVLITDFLNSLDNKNPVQLPILTEHLM